ncbi:MAG: IreB family regulatory phosphoprotein [Clostridia bacterium]|nr:IreB family regulatory phosphoprotein [Clostridia bacterium]
MSENKKQTITFDIKKTREDEIHEIITSVYNALLEKGYNPINQLVGYIMSEDPTYITNHNNARGLIRKFDREELMKVLVKNYLNIK